eukprot:g59142.t1
MLYIMCHFDTLILCTLHLLLNRTPDPDMALMAVAWLVWDSYASSYAFFIPSEWRLKYLNIVKTLPRFALNVTTKFESVS